MAGLGRWVIWMLLAAACAAQGQQEPLDARKDQQSTQTERPESAQKKPGRVEATKEAATATLVKVRDWETHWLTGTYIPRNRRLAPLSAEQRQQVYLQQTFLTPGTYMKRLLGAGIDQARDSPAQWGGGMAGYSRRFGSREGQFIIQNSLAAAGNSVLGYEPRYDQCRCAGFWPRTRHAMVRDFLTYDRTETRWRPQAALYAGTFVAGMLSTTWKPGPRNAWAEGGRAVASQVGFGVLVNGFTEFAVDINRKLGGRKR